MREPAKTLVRLFLPPNPLWALKSLRWYWRDYRHYVQLRKSRSAFLELLPALTDRQSATPIGYYFYQDTWAFKRILLRRPERHVDVGSTALLVGCLACVVPTLSVDVRPLKVRLQGLSYLAGSITSLPFDDNSVESLSSLCVVEHIGLGRYGDPLDPDGSAKAGSELSRVLAPKGDLYVSLPLGPDPREVFNAHRIFTQEGAMSLFHDLKLVEFALVGNEGPLYSLREAARGDFPVGLFHFTK